MLLGGGHELALVLLLAARELQPEADRLLLVDELVRLSVVHEMR